ncbi:hypothetical protein AYM39_05915 [Methylomonas sp. DH-1]|nr:hypothetical protein AYM39_05915 [Methylomonas sp. DH-1]
MNSRFHFLAKFRCVQQDGLKAQKMLDLIAKSLAEIGVFFAFRAPCLLRLFYVKIAALSEVAGVTFGVTQKIETCKSQKRRYLQRFLR